MEAESDIVSIQQDMSDECFLKMVIQAFYETAGTINRDNRKAVLERLCANTNVILSLMNTYLYKFNNPLILDDYAKALKEIIEKHQGDKVNPYYVFLGLVETVSVFLGLQENIIEKLAEQLYGQWEKWGSEQNA